MANLKTIETAFGQGRLNILFKLKSGFPPIKKGVFDTP
ncbi:hypothetical protein TW89_1414 [Neisseria flavescens]|nr:hypothetical protein TW89_1414 [Neisseria flavescens]